MANVKNQKILYARQGVKHTSTDADISVRPFTSVKITTVTSQTDIRDSVRAGGSGDADSFWNEYFLIAITSANGNKGLSRKVTSFTNSTGSFVIAAFPNNVATSDTFMIAKFVNAHGLEYSPDINEIVRETLGKGIDPSIPVSILIGASIKIEAHVTGLGTYPAAGTQVSIPPQGDLYRAALGLMNRDKPSTISGAASITTRADILTNTHEGFTVGNAVLIQDINASGLILDEARWILGKTDGGAGVDQLFINPAFTVAPVTTAKRVYGSVTFGLLDDSHPRVTVEIYQPDTTTDGQVVIFKDCLTDLTIGGESSNLLGATFDLTVGAMTVQTMPSTHFARNVDFSALDEEPSWGPIQTVNGEFSFRNTLSGATFSGTLRDLRGFEMKLGLGIARKKTFNSANGIQSARVTSRNPVITLQAYLEGAFTDLNDIINVQIKDFQMQLGGDLEVGGSLARNIFVCRVPYAVLRNPKQGDEDGLITFDLECGAARDKSKAFEDITLGAVAHAAVPVTDSLRMAIF